MEWIVCDNCGNSERKAEAEEQWYKWFVIGSLRYEGVDLHYCSPECLQAYVSFLASGVSMELSTPKRVIDRQTLRR